jgi:hypothetical protein
MRVWESFIGLIRRHLLHQLVLYVEHDFPAISKVSYKIVQGIAIRDPTDETWGTCVEGGGREEGGRERERKRGREKGMP